MSGELDRSAAIGQQLSAITAAGSGLSATGGGEGGGYVFDEATLRTLVKGWTELAEDYSSAMRQVEPMYGITPPAEDFASQAQVEAANNSGRAYAKFLEVTYSYCMEQAQKCQDALDDYLGVEERTVIEINKTGGQAGL